jgi:hypothetical protein
MLVTVGVPGASSSEEPEPSALPFTCHPAAEAEAALTARSAIEATQVARASFDLDMFTTSFLV